MLFCALCAGAVSEPLQSGDVLQGETLVRFSGETVTWTSCHSSPAERAEFEISERVTDQLVASGSAPVIDLRAEFSTTLPRTGFYEGRVRACNDDQCSDWVQSGSGSGSCPGSDYVYAILAPPGAPEL